jgi:hypothetical protein
MKTIKFIGNILLGASLLLLVGSILVACQQQTPVDPLNITNPDSALAVLQGFL